MITAQSSTLTNGAIIVIDQKTINAIKPIRMMLSMVLSFAVISIRPKLAV